MSQTPEPATEAELSYSRFRSLQDETGLTEADARRLTAALALIEPMLPELADRLGGLLSRHPVSAGLISRIVSDGVDDPDRGDVSPRAAVLMWLRGLLSHPIDAGYVDRLRRLGERLAEGGGRVAEVWPVFSHIRGHLALALDRALGDRPERRARVSLALHRRIDLEMLLIELACEAVRARRLERVERLAALGQVAGGIAHEMRQPLNVIRCSVWLLERSDGVDAEKRARHLAQIEAQVMRAEGTIAALSDFLRLPRLRAEAVPVHALLRDVLSAERVPAEVTLRVSCSEALPSVRVDAAQMRIALGNLVRNGCEAMPGGGELRISAVEDGEDAVQLRIADSGPGLSAEAMRRITEPLYTSKAEGMGLGLAMARSIIDRQGGGLSVHSEPGRGAVFVVRLPVSAVGRPRSKPVAEHAL